MANFLAPRRFDDPQKLLDEVVIEIVAEPAEGACEPFDALPILVNQPLGRAVTRSAWPITRCALS